MYTIEVKQLATEAGELNEDMQTVLRVYESAMLLPNTKIYLDRIEDIKFYTLGCKDRYVATDHPPLVKSLGDKSLADEENPRLARIKTRTLWWDFKNIHVLPLQSLGPRCPQHKYEQWCQPFVDCKEKPKYDTVHGVINTTNEVAPKAKNVNLGNVWSLMNEKEESGNLAKLTV